MTTVLRLGESLKPGDRLTCSSGLFWLEVMPAAGLVVKELRRNAEGIQEVIQHAHSPIPQENSCLILHASGLILKTDDNTISVFSPPVPLSADSVLEVQNNGAVVVGKGWDSAYVFGPVYSTLMTQDLLMERVKACEGRGAGSVNYQQWMSTSHKRWIAHRGLTHGPNPDLENLPNHVEQTLGAGFDVLVDVWRSPEDGTLWLGHPEPQHQVDACFLMNERLWCRAANSHTLLWLLKAGCRCLFHDTDDQVLTSDGWIWTYPGEPLTEYSICVLPERSARHDWTQAAGVCSDYVYLLWSEYWLLQKSLSPLPRTALLVVGDCAHWQDTEDLLRKNLAEANGTDVFMVIGGLSLTKSRLELRRMIQNTWGPQLKALLIVEDYLPALTKQFAAADIVRRKVNSLCSSIDASPVTRAEDWYKTRLAWELMEQYEFTKRVFYDRVVRARSDLLVNCRVHLPTPAQCKDIICGFDDHLLYGGRELMAHACRLLDTLGGNADTRRKHPTNAFTSAEQLKRHMWRVGSFIQLFDIHRWNIRSCFLDQSSPVTIF